MDRKINKGAIVRAEQQKKEAKERIKAYNENPHLCQYCGEPIYAPMDKPLRETLRKRFCSRSCATLYQHNDKKRIIDDCTDEEIIDKYNRSINKKDFLRKLGYSSYKVSQRILDRLKSLGIDLDNFEKLYGKSQDEIIVASLTKNELFERYPQWQTARSSIQKSARKIYMTSDKQQSCIVCGYDKHFEVAHIKAVSSFSGDSLISEINDVNNLVALCPNHHWEYDHGILDIADYI